jgi:hypothetical protein
MRAKQNSAIEMPLGRWREPQARRALRWWRDSGLFGERFARAHGPNAQRLLWWRKRVKPSAKTALAPLTFIPAEVTGAAAAARQLDRRRVARSDNA